MSQEQGIPAKGVERDQTGPDRNAGTSDRAAVLTFAIVAVALLMASIDSTIVAVSLGSMMIDLQTNLASVAWTLTGYQFSQSIFMPVAGRLSDVLGRKRLFLLAVAVFTLSSMAAGLAPNIFWLIVFRIIQGAGGGTFLPCATVIVSDAFGSRRATAIGLFGSIFPIGGIIGPNLGGFIVDHFSWRWIFFVNVPIGILMLVLGVTYLKDRSDRAIAHKLDIMGAGLFSAAVLALLYAFTNTANDPEHLGIDTWILVAVSAVFFVLFVRHESRTAEPIIDINLLSQRPFLAVNIYNFIFGVVAFGLFSFVPYYATIAYGMSASESGFILTPRSVVLVVTSAITSFFIIRFRYRAPMIIGLLVMSGGVFLLSRGYHQVTILGIVLTSVPLLALMVMIAGVGIGIANPAANNAALDIIPEKIAVVAGLRGMFRSTGGVFGTASVVLALSFFQDKAQGMQDIFLAFVVLLLALIPIVFLIPDAAHERMLHHSPATR